MIKLIIIFLLSVLTVKAVDYDFVDKKYIKYKDILHEAAAQYRLPELLILAIPFARENKEFDPLAVAQPYANSEYVYVGLLMLQAKRNDKIYIKKLKNARVNILAGCRKLREYINIFKKDTCIIDNDIDILKGLTAYRLGPFGGIRYGKISGYAYDIYKLWKELVFRYSKHEKMIRYKKHK